MADITYNNTATERKAAIGLTTGKGEGGNIKMLVSSTVELAASASGQTIKFGRVPSNARITGMSRVYWDDLATSGSPTLDIGFASVNANITSDPDALSNGHAIDAADVQGEPVIDAIADLGLPAWDFVNGQASDPGGSLDVYGTVKDAPTHTTGTIAFELYGYLD